MRVSSTGHEVESSGLAETGSFSIKNSPHAFHILSSGLYSNKIRAVIRELSCNAVDAHTAAGTAKTPIEVKLPNALDKQFYVKDFGTGLTHEQVMKLYTTYFESTKQESNDFIGGLGVGSKSPFAYTDSFTVESRKDGKKRIYAAYLSENSTPAISLMSEEDTTEPNGMTVGFPVKPEDFHEFSTEAESVYRSFKVIPTLKGVSFKVEPVKIDLDKLTDTVYVSSEQKNFPWNNCVRMGNVVYPIDIKKIANGDEFLQWITAKQGIFIDAPIGTYSVAASREQLQYDPATVAAFNKDMAAFKESWLEKARKIKAKIDAEPEEFVRKRMIYNWLVEQGLHSTHYSRGQQFEPKKVLESLKRHYQLDIPFVNSYNVYDVSTKSIKVTEPYTSSRAGQTRVVWPLGEQDPVRQRKTTVHADLSNNLEIIFTDTKQYKDAASAVIANTKDTKFIVVSPRKDADPAEVQKEFEELKAAVGRQKIKLSSALPKPTAGTPGAKQGPATTKEEIRACALNNSHSWGDNFEISPSNMQMLSNSQSFVWIPYTPSSKEFNGKTLNDSEVSKLGHLLNALESLEKKLGRTPTTIYAVNTVYRGRMDAFPDAITLEKHIENLLEAKEVKKAIDSPRKLIHVEYQTPRGANHRDFQILANLAKAIKDRPLGKTLHETLPKDEVDSKIANLCLAMHGMYGKTVGNLKNVKVVEPAAVHGFIEKNYPLISTDVSSDNYDLANRYAKGVAQKVAELNKYLEWKDRTDNISVSF